ncbi:MAG: hypothetical protein DME00_14180 [Candidatus Rokuibacteriota bacterium]|nr:MAG: hypothetical protein DME00_14180 [Candidatus Rokubacteria bacterium]
MIGLARAPVVGIAATVDAHGPAIGRVGQENPYLLERLANDAHPVADCRRRWRGEIESARGLSGVEAPAPGRRVVGAITRLDLAAWKHEVARGELARAVTADQQDLERAGGATAEENKGRGRDRRHRRRFDGHDLVCHDDAAAVIHFMEDGSR